jgi:hypothetical protein
MARVLELEMVMGEDSVYIVYTCQLPPTLTLDTTIVLLQMARVLVVEMVMREESVPASPSLPDVPFSTRLLAAGTGGVLCWLPVYPIDQVKSRMQTKPLGTYPSWLHCAQEIYHEQGIRRGFFKGLEPCLLRAFPAYAAQFLIFERLISVMQKERQ